MNSSLYEITQEYLNAFESLEIDEETGEILNYDVVDAIESELEQKAENTACYIKNLDALAVSLKAEEQNLAARRKAAEKKVENLKKYLTDCLDAAGYDKMETARAKISFRKSVTVLIEDEQALPKDYMVETITHKPDKTAIKKAIQSGEEISGASLMENRNIQIK